MAKGPYIITALVFLACGGVGYIMLADGQEDELAAAVGRRAPDAATYPTAEQGPSTILHPETAPIPSSRLVADGPPHPNSIQGSVRMPDGDWAEGATVEAQPSTDALESDDPSAGAALTTTTDHDGRFSMTVPLGTRYRVVARLTGCAPAVVNGVRPGDVLGLVLREPAGLAGRVLEENTEQPIPGVKVGVRLGPDLPPVETLTDSDGAFQFTGLPPGRVTVFAEAPEHVDPEPRPETVPARDVRRITFHLARGKSVRGIVVTQDDVPVSFALASSGTKTVSTNAAGRFELRGLATEMVPIRVTSTGFLPQEIQVNLAGSRLSAETRFVLRPGATVHGQVTSQDGHPVDGADVVLCRCWNKNVRNLSRDWTTRHLDVKTGGFGNFEIRGVEPRKWESYVAVATVPGLPPALSEPFSVTQPDERVLVHLRLDPGGEVTGTVVDEAGAPVADSRVTVLRRQAGGLPSLAQHVVTDATGAFRFTALGRGFYQARATAEDFCTASSKEFQVVTGRPVPPMELVLERGQTVAGRVVDGADSPLPGVEVTVSARQGAGKAVTDDNGKFEIPRAPGGPWSVRATRTGLAPFYMRKMSTAADGLLHIQMRPQAILLGTVVDAATGKPVERFRVALTLMDDDRQDQQKRRRVRSRTLNINDKEGRFQIQVEDGDYRLDIVATGYIGARRDGIHLRADAESPALQIPLRHGGAIEGYVRDRQGGPRPGVVVRQQPSVPGDAGFAFRSRSELDGYFLIQDLEAGLHDLVFQDDRAPLQIYRSLAVGGENPAWLEVTVDGETVVDITVRPPRRQNPSAPGQRRRRPARAMVTVESLDHLPIKLGQRPRDPARGPLLGLETTFTDRNTGRKRLTHLPMGRYRVIARFPGLPDLEEEIQLGFGDERKVTFDFERQRKSLAEGSPKPGAAPR